MATKGKSKKLDCVRFMPPLYHKMLGHNYEMKKSQVLHWLAKNPFVLEYAWDSIKQSGNVFYNSDTGKWQGVDYESDD